MSFSSGNRRALAEINITPLVDVMLVLLIVFMVAAPLIQTGVQVDLPQAKTPPVESSEKKLVLTVTKDKRILLADVEIAFDELEEKLRTNARVQEEKELYLHADRSLNYGVVIEVMALAKSAGVESLGMITDPPGATR